MRRPTPIDGSAPGTMTVRSVVQRPRPIVAAARSSVGLTRFAPAMVLTTIGKKAAYATISTAAGVPGPEPQDRQRQDRDRGDRPEALHQRIDVALDAAKGAHRESERNRDQRGD